MQGKLFFLALDFLLKQFDEAQVAAFIKHFAVDNVAHLIEVAKAYAATSAPKWDDAVVAKFAKVIEILIAGLK